jgi:hypothetical protein
VINLHNVFYNKVNNVSWFWNDLCSLRVTKITLFEIGVYYTYFKRERSQHLTVTFLFCNHNLLVVQAIDEGYLFVLHHPLSNDLRTMKDKGDSDPRRKMWKYMSPIALFASVPGKARLLPIAIQMDYKPGKGRR